MGIEHSIWRLGSPKGCDLYQVRYLQVHNNTNWTIDTSVALYGNRNCGNFGECEESPKNNGNTYRLIGTKKKS